MRVSYYFISWKSLLGSTTSDQAVHKEPGMSMARKKRRNQAHGCWASQGPHSEEEETVCQILHSHLSAKPQVPCLL